MTDGTDNSVFGDDQRSGQRRCGRMTDGAVCGFLFVTGGAVDDYGNMDKPRC